MNGEDHAVLEKREDHVALAEWGSPGRNTAVVVIQEPESWTSTSFPEIQYPGLGKGEKERLCASVSILKDFSILMKTLSHYSKSV